MDVDDEEMRRLMNRDIPLSELKNTLRSVAEIIRNRGFDVTPLRKWVAETVDADKVCNSDTDFFIVTYSLSDRQELELRASDLSRDELCDMLLASAYLPAFRLEKLGGKYYADGGVQDVVPIHALVEDGCKDIIALRIFGFGIEKRFRIPDDVHVTTIGPTVDLGNILNFDAEQSRRNMRLGYFDAQRVLYGLYGSTYYIDRTMSEDTARQQLLEYIGLGEHSLRTFHEKALPQIAKALKCDGDYYDLLIAVLEHDARALGIESERIVTDMELLQTLLAQPELPEQTPEAETEAPAAPDAQAPADADGDPSPTDEVAAKAPSSRATLKSGSTGCSAKCAHAAAARMRRKPWKRKPKQTRTASKPEHITKRAAGAANGRPCCAFSMYLRYHGCFLLRGLGSVAA